MKKVVVASAFLMNCVAFNNVAFAQPDLNNAPKAQNPANRNAGQARGERKLLKAPDAVANREAKRRELRLERIPKMLTALGVTDAKTQEAVTAHLAESGKARASLLAAQYALRRALIIKDTPDAKVKAAVATQRQAYQDYQAAFKKSLATLDEKIGYTKNARLEGALLAVGVLELEAMTIGN